VVGVILQVQNAAHSNVGENIPVVMMTVLAVQPGNHSHAAQNSDITTTDTMVFQPGLHGHTSDTTTFVLYLLVDSAQHDHLGGNVGIGGIQTLTVLDGIHAHTTGPVDLSVGEVLDMQAAVHDHVAEQPTLEVQNLTLAVNPALHNHIATTIHWEAGIDHGVTKVTVARGFKFRITPR